VLQSFRQEKQQRKKESCGMVLLPGFFLIVTVRGKEYTENNAAAVCRRIIKVC
jgi:hypothetical protein